MPASQDDIIQATKSFLLREVLVGEDPNELQPNTPLLSSGILDSISTIKLVGFLEDSFSIEFAAHEISEDHLDTLTGVAQLVGTKQSA